MTVPCIPYGGYWATPFARWQGSFAELHSIEFAAHVARLELGKRDIAPETFDYGVESQSRSARLSTVFRG